MSVQSDSSCNFFDDIVEDESPEGGDDHKWLWRASTTSQDRGMMTVISTTEIVPYGTLSSPSPKASIDAYCCPSRDCAPQQARGRAQKGPSGSVAATRWPYSSGKRSGEGDFFCPANGDVSNSLHCSCSSRDANRPQPLLQSSLTSLSSPKHQHGPGVVSSPRNYARHLHRPPLSSQRTVCGLTSSPKGSSQRHEPPPASSFTSLQCPPSRYWTATSPFPA